MGSRSFPAYQTKSLYGRLLAFQRRRAEGFWLLNRSSVLSSISVNAPNDDRCDLGRLSLMRTTDPEDYRGQSRPAMFIGGQK